MSQPQGTETRIAMRVSPEHKALIERGAAARSLSITNFMITLALREAEIAITERALFLLDEESYNHFLAILDRSAQEKPEIRRLIEKNRVNPKWKMTS